MKCFTLSFRHTSLLESFLQMKTFSVAFAAGLLSACAADSTIDLYQRFPKVPNDHALGGHSSIARRLALTFTEPRQLGKSPFSIQALLGGGKGKISPVKRVELTPSGKRAGAKRTKIYFGPHTIPKKGVVRSNVKNGSI